MHTNHASFDLDTQIITQDNAKSYCLYLLRHARECFLSDKLTCVWEYGKKHNLCLQYRICFSSGKGEGFSTWSTRDYDFSEIQLRDVFRALWAGFRYWLVDQWKMSLEPFDDVLVELEDAL